MTEKEDKKGDKALGNEQGLRYHKLEARQSSELGLSVAYLNLRNLSVCSLWSVRPYCLWRELSNLNGSSCGNDFKELK